MGTTAIHRAIEGQAANQGDAVALADDFQSMTYRELNQRANAVARRNKSKTLRQAALGR